MHKCRNVGCNESFKWRMQLCRHETKCSLPGRAKSDAIIECENGYQCSKCGRTYKYKENVYRHFKICKQKLNHVRRDYTCWKCRRPFVSKELLEDHISQCGNFNRQGVFVDTSNDKNVMLVIPVDENLLNPDNNSHDPMNHAREPHAREPPLFPYQPPYTPVFYPNVCVPNSSNQMQVIHPSHPSLSTDSTHIHSYPVDIKTVKRRTCSNCQRQFVRYDHFQRHVKKCGKLKKLSLEEIQQSLTCSKCDRQYQRKDHYERHTKKCINFKSVVLPGKKLQSDNNVTSEYIQMSKPLVQTNASQHSFKQSNDIQKSSEEQRKVEVIDLIDVDNDNRSSAIRKRTKVVPSFVHSNNNNSNNNNRVTLLRSSWEKALFSISSKVTIVNNRGEASVNNNLTLGNIKEKGEINCISKNKMRNNVSNSLFNQKNQSCALIAEKLIESHSNELFKMDASDRISNTKENELKKHSMEEHKQLYNMEKEEKENTIHIKSSDSPENVCMDLFKNLNSSRENVVNSSGMEPQGKVLKIEDIDLENKKDPKPDNVTVSLITPDEEENRLSIEKESKFAHNVSNALIDYLKKLCESNNSHNFHKMMKEIFQDQLNDQEFSDWLYKRLH